MVLSRPYHFTFFKGCLPQILLGPFWNTLPQMVLLIQQMVLLKHGGVVETSNELRAEN